MGRIGRQGVRILVIVGSLISVGEAPPYSIDQIAGKDILDELEVLKLRYEE